MAVKSELRTWRYKLWATDFAESVKAYSFIMLDLNIYKGVRITIDTVSASVTSSNNWISKALYPWRFLTTENYKTNPILYLFKISYWNHQKTILKKQVIRPAQSFPWIPFKSSHLSLLTWISATHREAPLSTSFTSVIHEEHYCAVILPVHF